MTILLSTLSVFLLALPVCGQSKQPDSAQTNLKTAITDARSAHMNVLLIFQATSCGWCKR